MYMPVSFAGKFFKWYLLCPQHPAKIRIENYLGRLFFRDGISIKNSEGIVFKLDANDWITRVMIETGNYEKGSVELAKHLLKGGGIFIDVGANFGLYSCQVKYSNEKVRVFTVEPNYKVVPRLVNNLAINKLIGNVTVINAAIGDTFSQVYLQFPVQNNLGTTFVSNTNTGGIAVVSCPLDFLLQSNNIRQVDLLKIDIEGNEFAVLKNFPFDKIIIKNIILEFNFLSEVSFAQLRFFFDQKGFNFFAVTGNRLVDDKNEIPENNIWIVNRQYQQD